MIRIVRVRDYEDMSRQVANIISAQIILKPNCVLGLATGSTPIGAYQQLVEWYKKGDVDFSQVSSYNLDEYRGLNGDDPELPLLHEREPVQSREHQYREHPRARWLQSRC